MNIARRIIYCFYDIASTVPEAIICTLPETTGMSINEETDKNIAVVTTGENSADENTGFGNLIVSNGTDGSETDNSLIINNGTNEALNEKDNGVLWLPIVIVVVIAVAAVLVIVIVLSKRKINNSEFSK